MSSSPPQPRQRRTRRAGAVLLSTALAAGTTVAASALPATAQTAPLPEADAPPAQLVWGVKESFVNYVTGNIGQGTITATDGASFDTTSKLFTFTVDTARANPTDVDAEFAGSINFTAHEGVLNTTITDVRVEVSGDSGQIIADVTSRDLGNDPEDPPVVYDDLALADLDLTGITPTETEGSLTWTDVPTAITAEGVPTLGGQYEPGTEMSPLTFSLPDTTPTITVSPAQPTAGYGPCTTEVTITGSGFDADANISTRPPIPVGMRTGVYVIFGEFADDWRPSKGAPSANRKVIDQKWPLPADSKAAFEAAFPTNPAVGQLVVMDEDGNFETTLSLAPEEFEGFEGNLGIYTYAAGGPINAFEETYTPIALRNGFVDVPESDQFHTAIQWMDQNCYTSGWDDGTFRPTLPVSRQALAAFLYRMAGSPEVPAEAPSFTDVPESNQFQDAIRWLASEGVITGWADGTFRPTQPVSRQAAAVFLHRYLDSPVPADDAPTFSDLPAGEFGVAIRWMAGEGITTGWADNTFRPTLPVSRQANAAFLYRTFAELGEK